MNSDQWHRLVKAQERSGKNVRRFCLERGITEHSLRYWKKKGEAEVAPKHSPKLIPVMLSEDLVPNDRLEIRLGELSVLVPLRTPGPILCEIIRNLRGL